MRDTNLKITIFVLILIIIGSIVLTIFMKSSWDTWDDKKASYKDLIELTGEISANANNVEELKKLKSQFDTFYGGRMIFAEADEPELLVRMMVLEKDLQNRLRARNDFYRSDKLRQSCQKLIKQLSATISSGDSRNRLRMFVPLAIGLLVLIAYFLFRALRSKKKKRIIVSNDKLPSEIIDEVKKLIGNAKTAEALKRLEYALGELKSPKMDELIMIKAQFNSTQKDRNLDLIDSDEARTAASKTNKAILDLIGELKD